MAIPGRNKKYKRAVKTGKNNLWVSNKERDAYARLKALEKLIKLSTP